MSSLWRPSVSRAFTNSSNFYFLLRNDLELIDSDWMDVVHSHFTTMATGLGASKGFGCVMVMDSASSKLAFSVVHETHLEIFDDQFFPSGLHSQDVDTYLSGLYRHFGASTSAYLPIRGKICPNEDFKHEKRLENEWTFEILESGKETVTKWLKQHAPHVQPKLSFDVIVPSYRVDLSILQHILELKPSATCTTNFIIIVDNPHSPNTSQLASTYSHRADVRILINDTNLGASASRNQGLVDSCAEWVVFFDDDVVPATDYLVEAERAIRTHPDAVGFIGNTYFPTAPNIFTTAIHLGGLIYFWDIADKIQEDVPWGVTASLITRRNVRDHVKFSPAFPKTGGGEDIDFCRRKRQASIHRGGTGFVAAPKVIAVHPWWNGGRRSYRRFFSWGQGDGALIKMHPDLAWRDWSPNSAETLLLSPVLILAGAVLGFFGRGQLFRTAGAVIPINTIIVNILHDAYRHCINGREHAGSFSTSVGRIGWGVAVCEGALIRITNEMGRLVGILRRGEWTCVGKRFDWFAGGPGAIVPERNGNLQRCGLVVLVSLIMVTYWH